MKRSTEVIYTKYVGAFFSEVTNTHHRCRGKIPFDGKIDRVHLFRLQAGVTQCDDGIFLVIKLEPGGQFMKIRPSDIRGVSKSNEQIITRFENYVQTRQPEVVATLGLAPGA